MAEVAVNIAVILENKILLTQREDLESWVLPGGGVEEGESLAQAAIRETQEETGLEVQLTGLVGVYSRLGNFFPGHIVLFSARPTGGEIQCQEGETIAVGWFPLDNLPSPLALGHGRRIEDALAAKRGLVVLQELNLPALPAKVTRKELIDLRDHSGLSRQDFYLHLVEGAGLKEADEVSSR
jgi:8-oxo-dGTP diphosphatase